MRMRLPFRTTAISLSVALTLSAALAGRGSAQNASGPAASGASTAAAAAPGARKVLSIADYSRWRSIEGSQISSDGKWVTYTLRFQNTLPIDAKPVLHILNLDTNQEVEVAEASNGQFSPDGRWIVYQVDSIRAPSGRGGRGGGGAGQGNAPAEAGQGAQAAAPTAQPPRVELRELATGRVQSWQNMQTFTFSSSSKYLLMRRRAAGGGGGRGAGDGGWAGGGGGGRGGGGGGNAAVGTDAILHDLTNGRSQFIGSVGEAQFDRKGELLAYTVSAQARDGNGLYLVDLANARTVALDNDAKVYSRVTWNDDGTALAALKGKEVERMRERENTLIVFPAVRQALEGPAPAPVLLDGAAAGSGVARGFVITERGNVQWSEDGERVFFGIMPQTPAENTQRRSTDSVADVDIWRTADTYIQSQQMIRADQERNFTFTQAFDVAAKKLIPLADSTMRDLQIAPDGRWAVGRDPRAYISDWLEDKADFYRVDTRTGERTPMFKAHLTGRHAPGITPDGKKFLYWTDGRYQVYDLDTGTSRTIGAGAPSFVDTEFDHPGVKPPVGQQGYTSDGRALIAQTKYDLWVVPLDGSASRNMTSAQGAQRNVRFRIVRTEPVDSTAGRRAWSGQEYDLTKPLTLNAFGELTKKDGFYRLTPAGQLEEIVFEDASFSTPQRAANAERWMFTRQTFTEYPNLRVSGETFKDARVITDANPQQAEFAWGRRVLIDYRDRDGHRLQGMLTLPDDYRPGERRPMLVNFYEKNSQNLNRYQNPSFITGMGAVPVEAVSRGYVVLVPDVYFHTGSSHTDMLDAVEAATKKAIELGYADPKRIGLNGHSYGGEGAAFIATRSKLFAAVGVGAGVSDLYTDFSQNWGWAYQITGGSGANGNEYYIYGQGRWGTDPWKNPELFQSESALNNVPNTTAAVLIMHGTADPTVSFNEGLKFYNALRYNGKNAILLAYPGEGHGLRGLANRRDLTERYFQFFDHYLKGAPAPSWITEGVPYIRKFQTPPAVVPATSAAPSATIPAGTGGGGS
jgi:dipeptidyl aminopeptidase/acylaminoacyl peptidase